MGRIMEATGRAAAEPYRISKIERNIYSVEELCYSLAQSAQFLDKEIMDPELVSWLRTQCGLPELADKLTGYLGKERSLADFISVILNYTAYMSQDKKLRTRTIVASGIGMELYRRKAAHAGYLTQEGHAYEALNEYSALLQELPEPERELRAEICYRMGLIYCDLFRFRSGMEVFYKSYALSGSRKHYLAYLTAVRLQLTEDEYIAFVSEHPEAYEASLELESRMQTARKEYSGSEGGRRMDMLRIYEQGGHTANFRMELKDRIDKLKDEYRLTCAASLL